MEEITNPGGICSGNLRHCIVLMSHFMPVQLFGTTTDSLIQWWLQFESQLDPVKHNGKSEISISFSWVPIVNRAKTFTAHCKAVISLDSSAPGVPDCARMFKSLYLCFQLILMFQLVFCIVHLQNLHPQGSVFPHHSPEAQQAPVLSTPGGAVSALLCLFPFRS